jgi:hypothetical protein
MYIITFSNSSLARLSLLAVYLARPPSLLLTATTIARVSAANTTKMPASTARIGRNLKRQKSCDTVPVLINFQGTILITGD